MPAVLLGAALALAVAVWLLWKIRHEREQGGPLPLRVALGAWAFYVLYSGLVAYAAWRSLWPLPLHPSPAAAAGSVLLSFGLVLYVAAIRTLGSWKRTSGLASDRLVVEGVYRWTRNPQMVGWALVLFGTAVAGRSGLAVLLAILFCVLSVIVVRREEHRLERVFGEDYRRYRAKTPRFVGLRIDGAGLKAM